MAETLVITGATGFIGGALGRAALSRGLNVIGLTRSRLHCDAPFTTLTLTDPADLGSVLRGVGPVRVIHAASPGTRPEERSSTTLVEGCVTYTLALVEACAGIAVERIVNVSSWSAYADPAPANPVLSEDAPLNRTNLYGAAKASAELMGSALAAKHGLEFHTARLFNVYGPGEARARLLPHVMSHLTRGERVALTPGMQERDFVFIDDVADALISLAVADALPSDVYNVASGRPVSVRALVEQACALMNAPASLLDFGALPGRPDEPVQVLGDTRRIKDDLGWTAKTDIETGLKHFLAYHAAGETS